MKKLHLKATWLAGMVILVLGTNKAIGDPIANPDYTITKVDVSNLPLTPITSSNDLTSTNSYIALFPNPATSNITLQGSQSIALISIIDILGRTIKQFEPNTTQVQINISDILPGRYFISVQQEKDRAPIIKSFIKI